MEQQRYNIWTRLRLWFTIHGDELRNITIVALGCLIIGGARGFDPVHRVAYHTATVHSIASVASRYNPRVRIQAQVTPDRVVTVTLKGFATHVSTGDRICLVETRSLLRNRRAFSPARPSLCAMPRLVPLALIA
jgi:hypothetical protein